MRASRTRRCQRRARRRIRIRFRTLSSSSSISCSFLISCEIRQPLTLQTAVPAVIPEAGVPMAWFQRDHTGRDLRPQERQFVAALGRELAEGAPPQIDESETALTAEGSTCLIALIPHRALAGISVVVWLF